MDDRDFRDYEGREPACVKHHVLRQYLLEVALKVGMSSPGVTFNYVDGFSGPWMSTGEVHADTSPHVALTQLRKARDELATRGRPGVMRGFFVEKNKSRFDRLQELLRGFKDIETEAYEGTFEDAIPRAARFVRQAKNPFSFVFIDPTGWQGYDLERIAPLLSATRGEVLINFMTDWVKRFIDSEGSRYGLERLAVESDAWKGLSGLQREDKIVETSACFSPGSGVTATPQAR